VLGHRPSSDNHADLGQTMPASGAAICERRKALSIRCARFGSVPTALGRMPLTDKGDRMADILQEETRDVADGQQTGAHP
jgi:hypothetical protein